MSTPSTPSTGPEDRSGFRPADHRLELLAAWLDATDRVDNKSRHDLTLKLRAIGLSICVIEPVKIRGGHK
jgi:hypothetical protein